MVFSLVGCHRRIRPGRWWNSTTCSPRTRWLPELGRRGRRRGGAAALQLGGRGGSAPATGTAPPGQQAARGGPMEPREGIGWLHGRGK
jgi:hypothetical protein